MAQLQIRALESKRHFVMLSILNDKETFAKCFSNNDNKPIWQALVEKVTESLLREAPYLQICPTMEGPLIQPKLHEGSRRVLCLNSGLQIKDASEEL